MKISKEGLRLHTLLHRNNVNYLTTSDLNFLGTAHDKPAVYTAIVQNLFS